MANAAHAQTQTATSALPVLAPGVTISTLQRVWFATPADFRKQAATLLESSILVGASAVKLRDLTLEEVEKRIGAVAPRFFVRYWQQGLKGFQVKTFVVRADADKFAAGKKLYAKPAVVQSLEVGS